MPREFTRSQRVAGQLQRELAALLRDARVQGTGLLTLTEVEVSRDLAHAKVYFTLLGASRTPQECARALNHEAGHLRHLLGSRLLMRSVPELSFHHDENEARAARLDALISEAVAADLNPAGRPHRRKPR
jgi:ribosome-binding factor A